MKLFRFVRILEAWKGAMRQIARPGTIRTPRNESDRDVIPHQNSLRPPRSWMPPGPLAATRRCQFGRPTGTPRLTSLDRHSGSRRFIIAS